ncbi:MAG TPA: CHAT domain-containing protein, partial [Cyclobacteriaceae bacterium]
LILAGANNKKKSDDADGILTAFEITSLDLKDTELVVLSACETGLGDVRNGDGVYGLQRAFKVAESRFIVTSLWKVDDDATMKLMTLFYQDLESSHDVIRSFGLAQKQLRDIYPSPYYWGAFKLVGN